MIAHLVQLIDSDRTVLATAQVEDEGTHFGGTIDLGPTPPYLRALFDEFEEVVNGQMFVFLDEVMGRIGALPIRARFADGHEAPVIDLQVFPRSGDVSFKLQEDRASLKQRPLPSRTRPRSFDRGRTLSRRLRDSATPARLPARVALGAGPAPDHGELPARRARVTLVPLLPGLLDPVR